MRVRDPSLLRVRELRFVRRGRTFSRDGKGEEEVVAGCLPTQGKSKETFIYLLAPACKNINVSFDFRWPRLSSELGQDEGDQEAEDGDQPGEVMGDLERLGDH